MNYSKNCRAKQLTSGIPEDNPPVLLTRCTEKLGVCWIPRDIVDIVAVSTWEWCRTSWLHLQSLDALVIERCTIEKENKTHAFLRDPNSRRFVDSNCSKFLPITTPSYMGHRLRARHTIVAWFESREHRRLHECELVGPVVMSYKLWLSEKRHSYMDASSREGCMESWGWWALWKRNLILFFCRRRVCGHGRLEMRTNLGWVFKLQVKLQVRNCTTPSTSNTNKQ